jgi:hypothetical protein
VSLRINDCQYAECRVSFFLMMNVIMMCVIMLNVVMLNVVMLNVVMLNVVMLNVVMLNVVMLFKTLKIGLLHKSYSSAAALVVTKFVMNPKRIWSHFVMLHKSDLDVLQIHH